VTQGPWLLSIDHSGVVAEIGALPPSSAPGPGVATYMVAGLPELHATLDRVYKLAMSLPEAPLDRFKAKTANLPRTTEAERWVIQRIGQDVFRAALLDYWDSRCPKRLDVYNGLLLSALWDAAFDQGLVSFADDGTPLIGPKLSEAARRTLGVDAASPLRDLRDAHRAHLAAHRLRHGFGNLRFCV
jgi:hypothetical protein